MDAFRKSGKKKNLRGGHFGEVLDELLNKICFPLRFCINNHMLMANTVYTY